MESSFCSIIVLSTFLRASSGVGSDETVPLVTGVTVCVAGFALAGCGRDLALCPSAPLRDGREVTGVKPKGSSAVTVPVTVG